MQIKAKSFLVMICSFWVVDNVVNLVYVSICMYILRKVVKWPFYSISLIRKDQTRWGNAWLFAVRPLRATFFPPGNLRQALGNFEEIVTWDPNSERTCKQRMYPAWKQSPWNSTEMGNIAPSVPRGTELSNTKTIFHQLCWMKYLLLLSPQRRENVFLF